MLEITPVRRGALRTLAQALKPIVWIGAAGLSESIIHELDQGLKSHELIKIKVSSDEREKRKMLFEEICERLEAAPVQQIGRILVIYRAGADKKNTADNLPLRNERKSRPVKQSKQGKTGNHSIARGSRFDI